MKKLLNVLLVAGAALGLMLGSAMAQTAKPSAAALGYAKEILAAKNVSMIYQGAVPGLVQRTKDVLLQSNLNYQKDLEEVSVIVAKEFAGREKEIGEEMARIYATAFTEAELKDLATFYKSPLGAKVIAQEPVAFNRARQYMDQWAQKFAEEINGKFRAEMKKRGKEI
ncbi:MAG: hypothetical protein BGN84_12155 [Afipia sp. 62-7]|nr:DUF2059 domain-containing protein [Afipia sp.]OJU18829.1 MAG: hypothetical protein BGN84_12155 [Afipia sp. 62-7]